MSDLPKRKIIIGAGTIESAIKGNSSHGMIADAVKTCVKEANYVSVDLQTIRWTDGRSGDRLEYLTPRAAQVALVRFDAGKSIEPFSMWLWRGRLVPNDERRCNNDKRN